MSSPISRIGDIGVGTCPCHDGPVGYTTIFLTGSPTVDANALPVVRIGDLGVASCGHITTALTGSSVVDANAIGVHRIGDMGANCGSYVSISGSPTVDAN